MFLKRMTIIFYFPILIQSQTADQIKEAKSYIMKSGISREEVIKQGASRGYSENEITKLLYDESSKNSDNKKYLNEANKAIVEIKDFENKSSQNQVINEPDDKNSDKKVIKPNFYQSKEVEAESDYFGYDIFKQDPSLFQASTVGAPDPGYLIGPKDEIIIMLWGETQFRQVLTVDREGFIFIPDVGQVFVNGLNLSLLESKLFRVFSQSYASLINQDGKATTFLDVSLGNLRPLRIQVIGEVKQPGAYTVSPASTIFSSLYYFRGPTKLGSLREIHLIRNDKKIASIDFYNYLLTGKKPQDVKLQLDDVIFVPRRLKTVKISGQINKPSIYELKEDESLMDLIQISGGLSTASYQKRAQVKRIIAPEDRKNLKMDRSIIDIDLYNLKTSEDLFSLNDGDEITIFSINEKLSNYVTIKGGINRPGEYELSDSLRVNDLIAAADDLISAAYLEKFDIFRMKPDMTETLLKLNLRKALSGDSAHNIFLKPMDIVQIYSVNEMVPKKFVSISGSVFNPGQYTLRENMKISDLVFVAGGYIDKEFREQIYLNRADLIRFDESTMQNRIKTFNLGKIMDDPEDSTNFYLEPADKVRVYSKKVFFNPTTISIRGVIKNEGSYEFKKSMTLQDIILEAGGFSKNFYQYKVLISRIDPGILSETIFSESIELIVKNDYEILLLSENENRKIDKFELMPFDDISIFNDPFFDKQKTVQILGSVYYPGTYSLLGPFETIYDLIERAGGLKENAYPLGSKLIRGQKNIKLDLQKLLKNRKASKMFSLQSGDLLEIAEKQSIIEVKGAINAPGYYNFKSGSRVKDVLNEAGGLTKKSDKKNIFITLPNGKSLKYRRFLTNPKVLDGSVINVGYIENEEPFDRTEYVKDITNIVANFAQVISIIFIARN